MCHPFFWAAPWTLSCLYFTKSFRGSPQGVHVTPLFVGPTGASLIGKLVPAGHMAMSMCDPFFRAPLAPSTWLSFAKSLRGSPQGVHVTPLFVEPSWDLNCLYFWPWWAIVSHWGHGSQVAQSASS